ncbi:MAG: extracellular solute-binding protein [Planctomycetaceae bacterium]|nr:extracellular solute-binding protein [Planctomycetaceae bacterium]
MKKALIVAAVVVVVAVIYFASSGTKSDKTELSLFLSMQATEPATLTFEDLAAEYMKENPDVSIEVIVGGGDAEAMLKTKMAANDLPDMWTTHGWSLMRYSEYLEPLNDQPWAKDISPLIKPAITGKDGKFYVLPMDVEVTGIPCNMTVLEKSGVDADAIRTLDDLFAACEKVKQAGFTPMVLGGKDIWPIGQYLLWTAFSELVADTDNSEIDNLTSGQFPEEKWVEVVGWMHRAKELGYFNVDVVTSSYNDSVQTYAQDKAAFIVTANYAVGEALTYNPNGKFGFIPIPSADENGEVLLMTGERAAVGVWKDSPRKAESLKFIAYLAQPENIARMATAGSNPTGLTNSTSDTGMLKPFYEKYASVTTYPIFDRAYLPSGMWDTLCTTGAAILAGSMTPKQAAEKARVDYDKLYHQ